MQMVPTTSKGPITAQLSTFAKTGAFQKNVLKKGEKTHHSRERSEGEKSEKQSYRYRGERRRGRGCSRWQRRDFPEVPGGDHSGASIVLQPMEKRGGYSLKGCIPWN